MEATCSVFDNSLHVWHAPYDDYANAGFFSSLVLHYRRRTILSSFIPTFVVLDHRKVRMTSCRWMKNLR